MGRFEGNSQVLWDGRTKGILPSGSISAAFTPVLTSGARPCCPPPSLLHLPSLLASPSARLFSAGILWNHPGSQDIFSGWLSLKTNLQEEKKIFNPYTCWSPVGLAAWETEFLSSKPSDWRVKQGHVNRPYQYRVRKSRTGVQGTARDLKGEKLYLQLESSLTIHLTICVLTLELSKHENSAIGNGNAEIVQILFFFNVPSFLIWVLKAWLLGRRRKSTIWALNRQFSWSIMGNRKYQPTNEAMMRGRTKAYASSSWDWLRSLVSTMVSWRDGWTKIESQNGFWKLNRERPRGTDRTLQR